MADQDTPPPTITAMKIPIIKKGEYDIWSMRMRQYICHTDHNLWDIIVNGDLEDEATPSGEQSSPPVPKTAKQLAARRNQERIKSILLLAIPDEYLLKFHNVPDAKSLWAAIKSRFGGNEESKKMQKNVLKHQFENFVTASNETLDKAYDRFQKLISQETHKVYEDELKRSSGSNSASQNLAFLSSENTNSTNEVSTASGDFGVSTGGGINQVPSTPSAHDIAYSFLAQPTTSPQLESFKCLQKNYDTEREKHNKAKLEIRGYEIALESLEARILGHEKNELAWGERYEFQNYDLKCREIKINNLNLELEKVVKERDELKLKIEKWEGSSKNLTKILNSQMSTHDKNGLGFGTQMDDLSNKSETDSENSLTIFEVRSSDEESTLANNRFTKANEYHAVPPPITGNPLTPRADISFAGLDEYAFRNKIIESKTTETNKTVGTTNEATIVKPKSVNETVVSKSKINRDEVIIEDWTSDDEDDVCAVKTVSSVKPNVTQAVRSQADKSGQTSQKQGIGFKKVHKIKACFVCKSTDHLIKDCDFYKSPEPRVKNVVNTGERVVKPVWDYGKRVNHQNFSKNLKYPHAKRTFNPSVVLTRAGLVNTDRSNVSTARSISTVRPVYTVRLVSTDRSKASNSPLKRSYFTQPVYRPKDLKPDVKTFGIKNMTTVGTRAVVSKGKVENVLKKAKWVWRPKMNYQDHVYKYNGSYMLKKFEYGNPEILLQDHAMVDSGCSSHMTSNKAYLSDYKDFNGDFVAFGSDPKGDKLLDESQVVLRAPRKDDVYNLDLICDNETEFKNYAMNELCAKKGIKREFKAVNTAADGTQDSYVAGSLGKDKGPTQEYILLPLQPHRTRIPVKDVVQDAQEQPSENASPDKDIQDSEDVFDKEGQHQMPEDEQVWQDELEMMVTQELVANAMNDESRQAFKEEKRRIASQKKAAQATSLNTPNVSAASTFTAYDDDEDVGAVADFNNMDNTIAVSPIPTLRRHKGYIKKQILREPTSAVQTRGNIQKWLSLDGTIEEEVYVKKCMFINLQNGFRRGTIDKTLFIKKTKSDIMLVKVYVDDIIYGSTMKSMYTEFEEVMHKRFLMSSMGELTFFLGLQVKQQPDGIFISQDKYVADILKKFDFCSIKTATTPIESNKPLVKDEDSIEVDVHEYRSMIGSLMYLTASRPDIMFVVCACARFQVTLKASHLHVVKWIFRYLKHQPKLGLWYPRDSPFKLEAFSYSDYAVQKQTICRKFNTEAEHYVCCQESVYHSKNKHIEIRHHFIKDCYEKRLIDVLKIHTDSNVADLLTKGFDVTRFNFLVSNWQTATVRTLANGTQQLVASIDSKEYTITEASVRSKLQLADATGIHNLSDAEIYAGLATLGYVTEGDIVPLLPAMLAGVAVDQEGEISRKSFEEEIQESTHSEILRGRIEDRGGKFRDMMDDPLVFFGVENHEKRSQQIVVTPTKASGEAQEEEISPTILEAAKTLSKVASQGVSKEKSTDKGKRYRRRARSMAKKIDTGLDAEEEINTGREEINTGIEEVSTGSTKVDSGTASKRGQREGKAPMVEEDIQASHKTKEQMRQEQAGLEEAIKLQAQLDEEVAKQIHLDKMIAKRMAEEEALTEQQKKRKAQVQFEAQFYTEEDWDAIRAKLEANAELSKDVLGKDLPEQDFAKRMAEMVNQRKKHFAEERAKAKRNKPMTQSQLRIYMSNYLKNQGTWKLSQLKKLKFEEIKEEFDKLVQQIDTFETKVLNKGKEKPVKRQGKRKKQKARKGINVDKSTQEDSETDKEESVEAVNPTPLTTKSDSVIMRANGADTVYMSFGAMVKDFTREDLIELYCTRLVMQSIENQ
ncbi:putative ribonuclease H-like domain-containing protein [Tanacetum coccineum]|uniref:Ribonuclease H-like domain-containing protein n=1 Tax=Tanacetum coccineum TaxID=301880 RepID=A0ABQ4WHQ0_9ASTR